MFNVNVVLLVPETPTTFTSSSIATCLTKNLTPADKSVAKSEGGASIVTVVELFTVPLVCKIYFGV